MSEEYGPRPVGCCGKCPPIVGGGYDCTCEDNPRCPVTAADRPPVTDAARAEAMSRYSFGTYHGQMVQWHDAKKLAVDAFIAGAEWAVARAETTTAGRNGRN